jgi:hypothetical protein
MVICHDGPLKGKNLKEEEEEDDENQEQKRVLERLVVDRKIILKLTKEKLDVRTLLNLVINIWVELKQEIIGHMSDYQFLSEILEPNITLYE